MPPLARRKQILESYRIDTVLDIGANSGQFAQQMRSELGFGGRISSFEPLSTAFDQLQANARSDPAWDIFILAIEDTTEQREINIASNSYSSSLLEMLPANLRSAPDSNYIGKEVIQIRPLDSLFGDLCSAAASVYMKIDTQGFESKVLKGGENSLPQIGTVQLEMSLVPLYDGELLFPEMSVHLRAKGYTLIAIENGFSDPASGQLLQVDGIFRRF